MTISQAHKGISALCPESGKVRYVHLPHPGTGGSPNTPTSFPLPDPHGTPDQVSKFLPTVSPAPCLTELTVQHHKTDHIPLGSRFHQTRVQLLSTGNPRLRSSLQSCISTQPSLSTGQRTRLQAPGNPQDRCDARGLQTCSESALQEKTQPLKSKAQNYNLKKKKVYTVLGKN